MTDPNELLQKINEVLLQKKATFAQLAEVVGEPEEGLKHAIQNYTVEVRMLERIAVELQLPLYRFFREPLGDLTGSMKTASYEYYSREDVIKLKNEIESLRRQLAEKQQLIDNLMLTKKA
jgi:hypothetical protein